LRLLDRLLATAEANERMGSAIEILIVRALALDAQGDTIGALAVLERALTLAEPEGYVRTFVDEGAPMGALLAQVAERESPLAGYAATLLAAFHSSEFKVLSFELAPAYAETQNSKLKTPSSSRSARVNWKSCA
jgi:LuxR family transcriptional regulator, maltose regulon positive regulatory protein